MKTETNMTTENLTAAFIKSNAKTISELWRFLGHTAKINGASANKIRTLVPNYAELFEANLNGKPAPVEPVEPVEPVAAAPAPVEPVAAAPVELVAAAKETTKNVQKGTKIGGYRAASDSAVIFVEGSKGFSSVSEFISRVSKILGKSEKKTLASYYIVAPKPGARQPTNRGTHLYKDADGTMRIVEDKVLS